MADPTRMSLRRALLEGAVIVLSILLAFGIDAWWDGTQDRKAERIALAALRTEFEANQAEIRQAMWWLGRSRQNASAFVGALQEGGGLVPDSTVWLTWGLASANPVEGALEGILGSRGLDILSDPVLKSEIAVWRGDLRDLLEDQRDAQLFLQGELVPVLARSGDLSGSLGGVQFEEGSTTSTHFEGSEELVSLFGVYLANVGKVLNSLNDVDLATSRVLARVPEEDPNAGGR